MEVCAIVYEPNETDCPINFPFDVELFTNDSSAGTKILTVSKFLKFLSLSESTKDYRALSSILEFEACDTRQCEDVIINDDLILELEEFFRVILSRTDSLDPRITLNPVNGVVHIIDNDCEKHSFV